MHRPPTGERSRNEYQWHWIQRRPEWKLDEQIGWTAMLIAVMYLVAGFGMLFGYRFALGQLVESIDNLPGYGASHKEGPILYVGFVLVATIGIAQVISSWALLRKKPWAFRAAMLSFLATALVWFGLSLPALGISAYCAARLTGRMGPPVS